jgi:hypothetical protein
MDCRYLIANLQLCIIIILIMIPWFIKKAHTPTHKTYKEKASEPSKAISFADFKAFVIEAHNNHSSANDVKEEESKKQEVSICNESKQSSTTTVCEEIDEFNLMDYLKPHIDSLKLLDPHKILEEVELRETYLLEVPTKPVLILDLDETLMFNGLRDEANPQEVIIPRPKLNEFLESMSLKYELWLWSASEKEYAEYVLSLITPEYRFKHVFTKESCIKCGDSWVKDIRIFGNLDVRKVIILDNLLVSFGTTLNNGILISPFLGNNSSDNELEILSGYLGSISHYADYREILKSTFNYAKFIY